jgi:predicted nucleic acid-binding protein
VGWESRSLSKIQQCFSHCAKDYVLALGLDCKASAIECFLITGDEALRRRARRFGVDSVDAPHLVQLFAETKLLTAAQPCLDRMRLLGFGIPQPVYEEILRQLGE